MSKNDVKIKNLTKLENALEVGRFTDANGREQVVPLKADSTVGRGNLADALDFARSAFQMATMVVDGAWVMVESDFALLVDKFGLEKTGKSDSGWGGRPIAGGGNNQLVRDLNCRIQKLEKRNSTLQLERDEANAKLLPLGYIDDELNDGDIGLPW